MKRLLIPLLLSALTVAACNGYRKPAYEREKPEFAVGLIEGATEEYLDGSFYEPELNPGAPLFIRIFKAENLLELWAQQEDGLFELTRSYPICNYSGNPGPKLKEGDKQSPEGFYTITPARLKPDSRFHLALNIGYPNDYDRSYNRTGSAIMIHGNCISTGCYAMTDPVIEQIYAATEAAFHNGQPFIEVHIFPFRMTDYNMQRYSHSQWYEFWTNLREGYDYFERNRVPPEVHVRDKRYTFAEPDSGQA